MECHDPAELREFLTPYPVAVQKLALNGRLELLRLLGSVNEVICDAYSAVCSGFLFTEKVRAAFVNLAVYSNHVTLVFGYGAFLDDPEVRLKGSGNQVRHIRLTGIETLREPYVVGLIPQAAQNAAKPDGPISETVIIKMMKGPKRRPNPA